AEILGVPDGHVRLGRVAEDALVDVKVPAAVFPVRAIGGAHAAALEAAVPDPPVERVHAADADPGPGAVLELAPVNGTLGIHKVRDTRPQADAHVLEHLVGMLAA